MADTPQQRKIGEVKVQATSHADSVDVTGPSLEVPETEIQSPVAKPKTEEEYTDDLLGKINQSHSPATRPTEEASSSEDLENSEPPPEKEDQGPPEDREPSEDEAESDVPEEQAGEDLENTEPPPEEGDETPDETPPENPEEHNQQLKLLDKAKKLWLDKKKAAAEWLKKNISKDGAKAAGKWLLMLLKNPYVIAALVILFLIIILFASCSKQTGKTPYQKPDPVKDKFSVTEVLAAGGDVSAQREITLIKNDDLKKTIASISSTNPDAQAKIDQIKQLLEEIGNISENPEAIREKIKQIFALLDQIKGLVPELAAQLDAFRAQLQILLDLLTYYQKIHLILNPKDMEYIRNFDVDRRIIIMLAYLVRPTALGGAGHERIKVKRIKFSYDTERKSLSKETDYAETEEPNVSAHFTGQAADIIEIDCIKCTQIKRRRLGSDSKSKLPPIPIKVAWQTTEGFAKAGGPEVFGDNMHQVFSNLGSGAVSDMLAQLISDNLGIDIDPAQLEGRSFGEITRFIGIAVLKQSLDIPGDYELGSDFGEIVQAVGRAYIAQALGIPFEGLEGKSEPEIMANIGRAVMETKMQLAAGSLKGNTSNEVFASIGQRKIEQTMRISRGSLSIDFSGSGGFKRAVGQGRVEASLGLKPGTFYGNSIEDVKKRIGKDAFDMTFASASAIDQWLGIATGSTGQLLAGTLSPNDYNARVGEKVIQSEMSIYQTEEKRAEAYGLTPPRTTESEVEGIPVPSLDDDAQVEDLRRLQNGDKSVFASIGKNTIAKTLTITPEEQVLLLSWFNTKNLPPTLDQDYLAGQYALKDGDLGKVFVSDLPKEVFERVGRIEVLTKIENNPELNPYYDTTKEIRFYTDRYNIIKENADYIANHAPDPEVKQKAAETRDLVLQIFNNFNLKDAKAKLTQIQKNVQFIESKSKESGYYDRVLAIKKAVNEIIEGRPITNFSDLSADSIQAKTNPQAGLTKKDILDILLGRKTIEEVAFQVGVRKWEVEFDLPDGSLKNVYDELKTSGFQNADSIVLEGIGKARLAEYGGLTWKSSDQVDRELGLSAGTTADFRAGRLTERAYNYKVGMAYARTNVASRLLNPMLGLENSPYALDGTDITKLLNGGWFYVALKIGGSAIDEALGFPVGGTLDIIMQVPDPADNPEEVARLLAETKLGVMAGLNHPISIEGDIIYNLGVSKIEQALGLKFGALNDSNLADKIREATGGNPDRVSRFDAIFGLKGETTQQLLDGSISPHDYIKQVGENLRNTVIYDKIALANPTLQNKELRAAMLALANGTGTPQEILQQAGANRLGEILGLDYPVSIRGNFKDNLGEGKIETRLGLKRDSFKGNLDEVVSANGQAKVEAAFYIRSGQLPSARQADSGYWNDANKNQAKLVDVILNIPTGTTEQFLTGQIDIGRFIDLAGQATLLEVTVDKLADYMELDDNYKNAAKQIVNIINQDKSWSDPTTQRDLFRMLMSLTGEDLDNKTQFDAGTWEKILFTDPNDPEHTGLKHADEIILEQGKKWMPRWLGLDSKYDPYVDLIYEQGLKYVVGKGYLEQNMVNDIKKITGIPNDADAARLLHGDVRGGLTAIGAGYLTQQYNKVFEGTNTPALTYEEVMVAYSNDPAREKAIGDAAVAAARDKWNQEKPGVPFSEEYGQEVRRDAIRESRDAARKKVMYAAIDMQLHKIDANIPAGFTQAMREGTSEQKWAMGIQYIGNYIHSENPDIPASLLPELIKYFDSSNPETFHNPDALSSSAYSFLDGFMKETFGDFVQPGTAKALALYVKTGSLGALDQPGTLAQIYIDFGINIVANWADKTFGLPIGSTLKIYNYYVQFQNALETYHIMQQTQAIAQRVFELTGDAEFLKEATKDLASAEAAVNAVKVAFYTWVITTIFQKQLVAIDQSLGLVPGSSAMLVGMTVELLVTGAVSPWGIALFILTNLFGVYRIDVICTACGYYPEIDNVVSTGPLGQRQKIVPDVAKNCPLGEFNGADATTFRQHSVEAAQFKVRQLLTDVYNMPKVLKDDNLIPTQIMTLRQEDVDYFSSQLQEYYGAPAVRGNSGLWANDLMWDHIHIGY